MGRLFLVNSPNQNSFILTKNYSIYDNDRSEMINPIELMVISAIIGRRNYHEVPNSADGKMGIPKSLNCWSRSA